MNAAYFIDENVLVELLQTDTTDETWQTTYSLYREPFVHNMVQLMPRLNAKQRQALCTKAFAQLMKQLMEGEIGIPLQQTLFAHLLDIGESLLFGCIQTQKRSLQAQKPTLAGAILVTLLKTHPDVLLTLYRVYQYPLLSILQAQHGNISTEVKEVYGETIMTLKQNVERGKLDEHLTARLFTYCCKVAKYKYLQLCQKKEQIVSTDRPEMWEVTNSTPDWIENETIDYLVEQYPTLKKILGSEPSKVFNNLIQLLDPSYHELLRLRLVENKRFRAIGEQLGIKEGTARRRFFNALRKWKRLFFRQFVYKDAKGVLLKCLQLHYEKNKSFIEIAKILDLKEIQVKIGITTYMEKWRKRYQYY